MSYRLRFGEELQDSMRRAAREQLEVGATELEAGAAGDAGAAVHEARKKLKRTRSLVRLARPSLPKPVYRDVNRALRDRGRAMSGTRDADVLVATVEALQERFAGRLPASAFDAVRSALAERAARYHREADVGLGDHANALRVLAVEVDELALQSARPKTLARALTRAYADGRAAFERADREPTTVHLHEWRKRVKDLWYQQKLVQDAWSGVLKAQASEAKALSKVLGDDHDLAVLADALGRDGELTAAVPADRDELLGLIAHRREELLSEARASGRRIYAETPKTYRRRVRRYLKAADAEAAARGPATMTA